MADRELIWKTLFTQACAILADAESHGMPAGQWTFGGGTVLMLKYRHRFSKDIDIFVPDPQYLGFLTPRLSDIASELSQDYAEQANTVKLYFPEGEVDFVASGALTTPGFEIEQILDASVRVETPVEIVAKKIYHRAETFKARDVFDLSLVLDRLPECIPALLPWVEKSRSVLTQRLATHDQALREDFQAIDALEYRPDYDHCLERLRVCFGLGE